MRKEGLDRTPFLQVTDLKMHFPVRRGFFQRTVASVKAVDGVSFSVEEGKTFGRVGESGCGKTTTGRCILRMYEPTSGSIVYNGKDITRLSRKEIRPFRHEIQVIFQDPYGSLDPRQSIGSIINEAIVASGRSDIVRAERQDKVDELLTMVGLDPGMGSRYPHELSGGQRQRVGIARALACRPRLIICDEPVSALDVSIQAQVINLFEELQRKLGLTYIFIAHDLAVVRHISDVVGVMYLGKLVEVTASNELYANPMHPYTTALLSAIPIADCEVERKRERIVLEKEIPSPINPPTGCPFHPRCRYSSDICKKVMPELKACGNGHLVACHNLHA